MERLFADDPEMVVWWATELECVSAFGRLERERLLSPEGATSALRRLDEFKAAWKEVEPVEATRRTARRLLRVHPLQPGDSLQLGAAVLASADDPASLEFVCLDARLSEAAQREGFPVVSS